MKVTLCWLEAEIDVESCMLDLSLGYGSQKQISIDKAETWNVERETV